MFLLLKYFRENIIIHRNFICAQLYIEKVFQNNDHNVLENPNTHMDIKLWESERVASSSI